MPRGRTPPLFLARATYRRRRVRDAARLLPVFGAVLLVLPLLWTAPGQMLRALAPDLIYFFGLWVFLVLVAAAFAPALSQPAADEEGEEEAPDTRSDPAGGRDRAL